MAQAEGRDLPPVPTLWPLATQKLLHASENGARLPKNGCSRELVFFKSVSLFLADFSCEDCKGNTGLNEGAHNLYKQAGYVYLCLPPLLSLLEGINTARRMVAKKRAQGEDISCSESLRFMSGEISLQWSGEAEK